MPTNYSQLNDDVAAALKAGQVGVIPTDTVYGLVALASNHDAIERLYQIKHREQKPGTIIAANMQQLEKLGVKRRYLKAVEQYWPNPLSVVIPTGAELAYIHQGKGSIAMRIPNDPNLQKFLRLSGPLLTSSANTPGDPPAESIQDAREYFGDQVDFYVDGGELKNRQPSTIIRVIDDAIEVLRAGAVTIDEKGNIT